MEPKQIDNIILALLFASEESLSPRKLHAMLEDIPIDEVNASIARIQARLAEDYPSILIERVAGGLQLATNPVYAEYLARLYSGRRKQRLTKAAMEAVAIIAYKQPITRAQMETIRGVGCGGVIATLMERSLIRISGKAKVLGAPFLYSTTNEFLEYLGLNSVKDLPTMEEFEAILEREERHLADGDPASDEENSAVESDEVLAAAEEVVGPDADAPADAIEEISDEDPAHESIPHALGATGAACHDGAAVVLSDFGGPHGDEDRDLETAETPATQETPETPDDTDDLDSDTDPDGVQLDADK